MIELKPGTLLIHRNHYILIVNNDNKRIVYVHYDIATKYQCLYIMSIKDIPVNKQSVSIFVDAFK